MLNPSIALVVSASVLVGAGGLGELLAVVGADDRRLEGAVILLGNHLL